MATSSKHRSRRRPATGRAQSPAQDRKPVREPDPLIEEPTQPFDEPATPPPRLVVPVEKPAAPTLVPEGSDTCGLPDEATTRASDLH